jgi:hypothetical protein
VAAVDISEVTGKVYQLLKALEADERNRVFAAVRALFGDVDQRVASQVGKAGTSVVGGVYPPAAERWLVQNAITQHQIEQVLHVSEGSVELIVGEVPGETKKQQSINCYLLLGLKELFGSGVPKFSDNEAIALCQHMGCYDRSNHSATRKSFGNVLAGSRENGYTLPAPGLRAVAELVGRLATG